MLKDTHEAALAMVDDLQHMRDILAKSEPTPGDIRRTSNLLRRILIDNGGDLRKVGPPRLNAKVQLVAPQLAALHRSGNKVRWEFLSAGTVEIFGITVSILAVDLGPKPRDLPGFLPDETTFLSLDNFNSQRVVCFRGRWITRRDIITYIANVAHGVHSGTPKQSEPSHELLHKIRRIATIKIINGIPSISYKPEITDNSEKPITIDRKEIDVALINLMSTAKYLAASPDIQFLENIIHHESL